MWAMMPMLRVSSRAVGVATPVRPLPPVMGEGLVRLRHLVGVFLLLDRGPSVVGGLDQLGRQAVAHGLLGPLPGEADDPAQGQGRAPIGPNLDRDLVRG